ncbi:hyalin-like [Patiria miniata]|uniref:HYR domain-containing protein n=1 Tax=Patiria miniata TaxID=46514 RepID=A0A913Z2Z7_PATMI|nr:hyalin-like [Patiria miniata]
MGSFLRSLGALASVYGTNGRDLVRCYRDENDFRLNVQGRSCIMMKTNVEETNVGTIYHQRPKPEEYDEGLQAGVTYCNMDKRPSSPQPNQVHQIVEKGAQIKRYISDILGERLLTMQGRPPAHFSTTYKTREDSKNTVDLTEKTCNRILLACGMTLVMLVIGASLVGGILLAVVKLDAAEDTVTVAALNLNINCPRDIVTRAEPGGRHAVVSWEKPELETVPSNANTSAVIFESNYEPNTSFGIGDHEVIYTVTDSEDNQETCSFKVKVRDKEGPVFVSCPQNIKIVTGESDGSFPDPTWDTPKAADNAGQPRITTNYGGSRAFELGTTVIRYTATDAAGNVARCVFHVTIIDGTPPVILGCPDDITGTTGRPEWRQPTAVDNGQLVSFESDWTPGDTFPQGRTRVTYVAEDSVGLKAECSFVVAVVDTEAPVFTYCPTNITVTTDEHGIFKVPTWQTPRATDSSGPPRITANQGEAEYHLGRPNEMVYVATDSFGNNARCSFYVTVKVLQLLRTSSDGTPPTIHGCPSDISQPTDRGVPTAHVYWSPPTSRDNGEIVDFNSNQLPGDTFSLGATKVVYTAVDSAGLSTECSFTVTIRDLEAPKFTFCPSNIEKNTDQDGNFDPPTWPVPIATDNTGLPQVSTTYKVGEFRLGVKTSVKYTATDASGNNATCLFYATVVDQTPPVISDCPTDITITADPNALTGRGNWTAPTATDNGVQVTLTSDAEPGDGFRIGRTRVTYTAVDNAGLMANCHFTVTVLDGTPPTIHGCPSDITQPTDRRVPTARVFWSPPTARDNWELADFNSNQLPGDIFSLGSTTVVYTAVDSAGLSSECSFTVTIRDLEAPKFTFCPSNIEKNTDQDGNFDPPTWPVPIATDNTGQPQVTAYKFGEFLLGVKTSVKYTATDASSNNATCLFYVTIIDGTPPVISNCPMDITITADAHAPTGRGNWTAPTATDNGVQVTLTSNAEPGDGFRIGRTRVTYTAVDNAGLTTNCHFTVTVLDNEAPVFTDCPADIFRTTDASGKYAYPIWQTPQAVDNSGDPPEVATTHRFQMYGLNSRTRIEYTATDASGNNATCVFYVSVTDGTPPELQNCPDDITLSTDPNASTSQVNWSLPTVADNSRSVDLTSDWQNGDLFPLGSTVVTFTAVDPSGLTTKCHFTVTVIDTEDPIFPYCPLDFERTTDAEGKYQLPVWETPTAVDNSGQVEVSTTYDFAPFELGVTTPVEYTATDPDDNEATCIFFVTILDGTRPVITNCPLDITLPTAPHLRIARVDWTEPTAEDNSGYVRLTPNLSPGGSFPLGKTKVVYTATDAAGLRDRCRFTVTVEDTEAPVFDSCPQDIIKETNANGKFDYPTWSYPHAVDNSGVTPDITTTSSFQVFPLEETTPIEYVATDQAGNTATCQFYITVRDRTPPEITDCPGDITVSIDFRSATGHAIWTLPVASDNGRLVSFESNWNSGDSFPAGETNVTYIALDSVGLTSKCQFTVTVEARCNLSLSTPAMRNTYQYRFPFPIARPTTDDSPTPLQFDFAVRSTGTVFVALTEAEQSTEVYEIGLGRSKTFIRCGVQCKPHYITVKVPHLMSATKYRHFWVTYDGTRGLVRVGRGKEAPFMEWQDPSSTPLDVQRLGIASYQEADWKGYLCRNGTSRGMGWL